MKKLIVLLLLMASPCLAVDNYIKNHEGFSLETYYVKGIPHIGYGHNCYIRPTPEKITKAEAERLFKTDIEVATENAMRLFKTYHLQPKPVRKVLVDMTYNMGYTKFKKWVKFRRAINNKQYCVAVSILKRSKWRRQVGKRGVNNIKVMEKMCEGGAK